MKIKILSELSKNLKIDCIYDSFLNIKFENTYSLDDLDYNYINRRWDEIKSNGEYMYEAPLVVVNKAKIQQLDGVVSMPICTTDFKNYFILKGTDDGIWGLGVSALILLNDDEERHFIFGERNSKNINVGGLIESVGSGFVESDEDIKLQLIKEISEEIGICEHNIDSITPLHIGSIGKTGVNNYRDICCDYFVEISGVDLTALKESAVEHKRLILVPYDELFEFVNSNMKSLTYRTIFTLEKYIRDFYE